MGLHFLPQGGKQATAQLLNFPPGVCVSRKEFLTFSVCACKWCASLLTVCVNGVLHDLQCVEMVCFITYSMWKWCVSELCADFHMTVFCEKNNTA